MFTLNTCEKPHHNQNVRTDFCINVKCKGDRLFCNSCFKENHRKHSLDVIHLIPMTSNSRLQSLVKNCKHSQAQKIQILNFIQEFIAQIQQKKQQVKQLVKNYQKVIQSVLLNPLLMLQKSFHQETVEEVTRKILFLGKQNQQEELEIIRRNILEMQRQTQCNGSQMKNKLLHIKKSAIQNINQQNRCLIENFYQSLCKLLNIDIWQELKSKNFKLENKPIEIQNIQSKPMQRLSQPMESQAQNRSKEVINSQIPIKSFIKPIEIQNIQSKPMQRLSQPMESQAQNRSKEVINSQIPIKSFIKPIEIQNFLSQQVKQSNSRPLSSIFSTIPTLQQPNSIMFKVLPISKSPYIPTYIFPQINSPQQKNNKAIKPNVKLQQQQQIKSQYTVFNKTSQKNQNLINLSSQQEDNSPPHVKQMLKNQLTQFTQLKRFKMEQAIRQSKKKIRVQQKEKKIDQVVSSFQKWGKCAKWLHSYITIQQWMKVSRGLGYLKQIEVSISKQPISIEIPSQMKNLKNLQHLKLVNCNVSSIQHLPNNLKQLNLSHNRIRKIQNLQKLKNLQTIFLCKNNIKIIQNLNMNQNLKHINLNFNEITHIENIYNMNKLCYIVLSNNKIESIEQQQIFPKNRIWNSQIQIFLDNNPIKKSSIIQDLCEQDIYLNFERKYTCKCLGNRF